MPSAQKLFVTGAAGQLAAAQALGAIIVAVVTVCTVGSSGLR